MWLLFWFLEWYDAGAEMGSGGEMKKSPPLGEKARNSRLYEPWSLLITQSR